MNEAWPILFLEWGLSSVLPSLISLSLWNSPSNMNSEIESRSSYFSTSNQPMLLVRWSKSTLTSNVCSATSKTISLEKWYLIRAFNEPQSYFNFNYPEHGWVLSNCYPVLPNCYHASRSSVFNNVGFYNFIISEYWLTKVVLPCKWKLLFPIRTYWIR